MSSGLAVRLPLMVDSVFGPYNLITDFGDLASQNLKMLILTNPGERMMDTSFGVGLRRWLFEQNAQSTYASIEGEIMAQVRRYLPYVAIERVDFMAPEGNPELFPNQIIVKIYFEVVPLKLSSVLEIDVNTSIN